MWSLLVFPNSLKRVKFVIERNLEQRNVSFILGHRLPPSVWSGVVVLPIPPTGNSPWHQLCILQCNSILTPSTWGNIRSHRWRGQSHKSVSTLLQMPVLSQGYHLCFWLTSYGLKLSSYPLLRFSQFAKVDHWTQRNILLIRLPVYYKMIHQDHPDEDMQQGKVWGKEDRTPTSSQGVLLSKKLHVVTNLEAL